MIDNIKYYEKRKSEAISDWLEAEREEAEELEAGGYSKSEDRTHWQDLYQYVHYVNTVGLIFVADEDALSMQPGKYEKVLAVWYDEPGRIVRHTRMGQQGIWEIMSYRWKGQDKELHWWLNADLGDDYDIGGIFQPQYELLELE